MNPKPVTIKQKYKSKAEWKNEEEQAVSDVKKEEPTAIKTEGKYLSKEAWKARRK
jgi:hypothetical protein